MKSKKTGLFITLLIFALFGLFLLIFMAIQGRLNLSITTYFFLLVICDLAATAFLTIVLKSTAEYKGNVFKGNLSITGSAVIFLLILYVGYKFRPVTNNEPVDLTFLLRTPTNSMMNGKIMIDVNNERRTQAIQPDGQVTFKNISPNYLGKEIHVLDNIDGYQVSAKSDTMITVPQSGTPTISLTLLPKPDSFLFRGFVHMLRKDSSYALVNAMVYFSKFNKTAQTDSLGMFGIWLPAKEGEEADFNVFQNKMMIYFNSMALSTNMQIVIPKK